MATSTIQQSNPITIKNDYPAGTQNVTIQQLRSFRYGNVVFLSVRLKVNNEITNASSAPLIVLSSLTPVQANMIYPSMISLMRTSESLYVTYSGDVVIAQHESGQYVLRQSFASTLKANDILSVMVAFPVID